MSWPARHILAPLLSVPLARIPHCPTMSDTARETESSTPTIERRGVQYALKDERLAYRACTRGWADALGMATPSAVVGRTDFDLLDREEAREQLVLDSRAIASGEARIDALRLPPGGEYAILLRLPLSSPEGRVRGLDLRLIPLLAEPESDAPYPVANYRALVNEGLQGSLIVADGTILFANGPAAHTLGHASPDALIRYARLDRHFPASEIRRVAEAAARPRVGGGRLVLSAHTVDARPLRLVARATRLRWNEEEAVLLSFIDRVLPHEAGTDATGIDTGASGPPTAGHATDRLIRRLRANTLRFGHFARAGADFFFELDASLCFRFVSRGAARALGIEPDSLIGSPHTSLGTHEAALDGAAHWDVQARRLGAHQRFRDVEFRWRVNEEERVIRYSGLPLFDRSGRFRGYRGCGSDVTTAVRRAALAVHRSNHDDLTGLCNRRRFEVLIGDALDAVRRRGARHVLCFLDLDHFKTVNDRAGHAAGDELLRQLAARLDAHMDEADVLARFGGDEFAVLMQHRELDAGVALAHRLSTEVGRFRMHWQSERFAVGASLGVVPIDARWGSADALFAAADAACYAAKRGGRNRVVVHGGAEIHASEQAHGVTAPTGTAAWRVDALREALERDRVEIVCQPLERLHATDASSWFETLGRLRADDGSLATPERFLPNAERFGLTATLDAAVLRRALRWLSARHPRDLGTVRCSVNVGLGTLQRPDTLAWLPDALAEHGLSGGQICFEIGEILALSHLSMARDFMQALAPCGCRFGVDGFGTGLSSFTTLNRLPIDFFKIDGLLVREIVADQGHRRLIETMIQIGHSMGREAVLMAVESAEQLHIARDLGADYAQGFHVGRPASIDG